MNDKGLPEVVSRWEQLLRFAALRLGRELGADVQVHLTRRELAEPALRFAAQTDSLVSDGLLDGSLRIPDAVAPVDITADLRAGRIVVSIDVDAPREGRATTRVNWLVRQLRDAPDGLRLDAFTVGSRTSSSALLKAVREDPAVLISDPKREFRMFRVAATSPLGAKRGVGRGSFIDSVLAALDGFYASVVQSLQPWSPKAPQLPRAGRTAVEEAGIDVEPPPRDLEELDDNADLQTPPTSAPDPQVMPSEIRAGVELGLSTPDAAAVDADNGAERVQIDTDELVAWDQAQDRLDHERSVTSSSDEIEPTRIGGQPVPPG